MKLGYIASNLYRHTFEINEAAELSRQRFGTCFYSAYRPKRGTIQAERLSEISAPIVTWSAAAIVPALIAIAINHPIRLFTAALELTARSIPNPVYWLKNPAVFLIAMPILNDARRQGVTHLHANFGSSPATIAWLGKRILGIEMSVTFHAFDIYYSALSHRDPLKRHKLRSANPVVAVHEHGLNYLRRLVPDEATDKFCVVRISVVFRPSPRCPAGFRLTPLLIAAGNLVSKKGFDVFIRAVGYLTQQGIDVRARILGDGPERANLEALALAVGVSDRIEIVGYYQHSEMAKHLSEATAFVMPCRVSKAGQQDGIPTVVVEAWLSRVPVIASLVGGMGEVIIDERTGLVFPPGDYEALAECVRRLFSSEHLGTTLSEFGAEIAELEFCPKRNVEKLLSRIDQVRN